MAIGATCIFQVQSDGNDGTCAGIFDPAVVNAGGFTDGAATNANTNSPVFTSASYAFVAGDVGAWVYIFSGTNWTPGFYKIASVAGGAATLVGNIGSAVSHTGATASPIIPSTVIGCATVDSPTGAKWSIDYSQQAAAQFAYTDLASVGAGLTVSSVLIPFAKQMVGNSIVITGGTNFNVGRYVIASVSAGFVATVTGAGNITSAAGVAGTGGQGGALATYGQAGAHVVSTNQVFIKTGSYTVTSATPNVAGGTATPAINAVTFEGYDTVRGDLLPLAATGTRPTITASGISTFILFSGLSTNSTTIRCLILDGASLTSSQGFLGSGICYNVLGQNFTNSAFNNPVAFKCSATGCSTVAACNTGLYFGCRAFSNTISGFLSGQYFWCLSYANSGATTDGFTMSATNGRAFNCSAYNNGRDGFRATGASQQHLVNCLAEANVGTGILDSVTNAVVINCAAFGNGTNFSLTAPRGMTLGSITGTASFFTNPGAGDFSLNNTAGGGALARAAGFPGVYPGGLTTGYVDIGGAQHADPAAGGGLRLAGHGGLAA